MASTLYDKPEEELSESERIDCWNYWVMQYESFLDKNEKTLEIFQGNLKKYVDEVLKNTLSKEYYSQIKDRILPINILQQYVNKVAKSYTEEPARRVKDDNKNDQQILDWYVEHLMFNEKMDLADRYATLFKGYCLDPFLRSKDGKPKLRVLPFDKFLPHSFDLECPEEITDLIKIMGKRNFIVADENGKEYEAECNTYIAYNDEEIIPFREGKDAGEKIVRTMLNSEGTTENPFGIRPQTYANRGIDQLVPVQDNDMIEIVKMVAVMLTDLEGAIMFKCFNIIYGIDVDMANLAASPNAIWEINTKKNAGSDQQAKVGSIENTVESEKVIEFILTVLSLWLETKGIKTGGVGQLKNESQLSGVSKLMDTMDTYEVRKKNIKSFKREEQEFWKRLKIMHNYWVEHNMLTEDFTLGQITGDFDIEVEFEEPKPMVTRQEMRANIIEEYKEGLIDIVTVLEKLHPEFDTDKLKEVLGRLGIDLENPHGDDQDQDNEDDNKGKENDR